MTEIEPNVLKMIGDLSPTSCVVLLTGCGDMVAGERCTDVLRSRVEAAYRSGRLALERIVLEWMYDQGWRPIGDQHPEWLA
jgi:hypothetical protein